MAKGLTRRQGEILSFIVEHIRSRGMPPTFAEIGKQFGISSMNGVNDHLDALERKGYIERSSKARAIQVLGEASDGLYRDDVTMVPIIGQIAAGVPLLAEENIEGHLPVASGEGRVGCYALQVRGDSMIEDGILNGDTIIVDPSIQPRKGDIIVALTEGDATVKRYHPRGAMVELRPANAAMRPLILPATQVRIQGVVTALRRIYR